MRTSAAVHSSMQSPRSFVRHPSRPHPWGIRSLQPLNDRSESLLELGRRFLDLEQSIIRGLGYRAKSRFVQVRLLHKFIRNAIGYDESIVQVCPLQLVTVECAVVVRARYTRNDPMTK